MKLPSVLIIGQPFNNNSGGGITQSNIFGEWDREKVRVVCTAHIFNNLNTNICDTYYLLGNSEYKWAFPFSLFQRKVLSGEVKLPVNTGKIEFEWSMKSNARHKIIHGYLYPFLEFIGIFHGLVKIELSDKLRKWIDDFKPDIIYAQASSRDSILFCSAIHLYVRKPMIFHMMDDWPSTISERGFLKSYWQKKIDREFRILLNQATVLLSISDYMAKEYLARYGKTFITFHNTIDIKFWRSHQKSQFAFGSEVIILYAGRIGTGINTSLENTAKAIELVNRGGIMNIKFVLQTAESPAWISKYVCVRHCRQVQYKDLPRIFSSADILLLPYDFSSESLKFIKYSMPTKAPEYMVSGTPIIIYAPEDTALAKNAMNNGWAKVVTKNNIHRLASAIEELCMNEMERIIIASKAIEFAESHYNSDFIRSKFKNLILSMVN